MKNSVRLDPQKTETHVENLPEAELWFTAAMRGLMARVYGLRHTIVYLNIIIIFYVYYSNVTNMIWN